jgi:hypothetical protein
MCMKPPKAPAPAPLPPTVTGDTASQSAAAVEAQRKRRAAMAGRQSTILTGGQQPAAAPAGKTLLGA